MDFGLLELLDKITERDLTKEQIDNFLKDAVDEIKEAKTGIILITDDNIHTMGRGIDILGNLVGALMTLKENRFSGGELDLALKFVLDKEVEKKDNKKVSKDKEKEIIDILTKLKDTLNKD